VVLSPPAVLTITANTNSKTYDASTTASAVPTASGLLGSDTVSGLSEAYANQNAGTGKTLIVNSGFVVNDSNSGGNYTVNLVNSNTGVITPAVLTLTAVTNSKTYDANTGASAVPTASGLLGTDTVTSLSEAYANQYAGTGKTLTVNSGYTVNDGNSGDNYAVNLVNSSSGIIIPVISNRPTVMPKTQINNPTGILQETIVLAIPVYSPNTEGVIWIERSIRQLLPEINDILSVTLAHGEALSKGLDYDPMSGQLHFTTTAALPPYLLITGWDRKKQPRRIKVRLEVRP
jgi:hypothetical protein